MGLSTDTPTGEPAFTGVSKFGVYLVDGAIEFYPEQKNLATKINKLSEQVNDVFQAAGMYGTDVFGYSAAFPYFETWEPAHDDLLYVAKATLIGGGVLSALTLGMSFTWLRSGYWLVGRFGGRYALLACIMRRAVRGGCIMRRAERYGCSFNKSSTSATSLRIEGVWAFLCHGLVLLAGSCAVLAFAMLGLSSDMNLVTVRRSCYPLFVCLFVRLLCCFDFCGT